MVRLPISRRSFLSMHRGAPGHLNHLRSHPPESDLWGRGTVSPITAAKQAFLSDFSEPEPFSSSPGKRLGWHPSLWLRFLDLTLDPLDMTPLHLLSAHFRSPVMPGAKQRDAACLLHSPFPSRVVFGISRSFLCRHAFPWAVSCQSDFALDASRVSSQHLLVAVLSLAMLCPMTCRDCLRCMQVCMVMQRCTARLKAGLTAAKTPIEQTLHGS